MATPARWATERSPERLTYGPAVGQLARELATPLLPWQQQVVDVALEIDPETGQWAFRTIIITVPRQAGKTTLMGAIGLHRAITKPGSRNWYTAQKREDARDMLMDLSGTLERSRIAKMFKVRQAIGSESLTASSGGTFRIFSPTPTALHGRANELVAIDEIWSLDEVKGKALLQAVLPTFTTTGGQLYLLSTSGTSASTFFNSQRDKGRQAVEEGRTSGIAYFEWSIGEDVDPSDLEAVLAAHPANGHTLRLDVLQQAAETMDLSEFARAYGNRSTGATTPAIDPSVWLRGQYREEVEPGPELVLTFETAVDESAASIGAGWRLPSGEILVTLVDERDGITWLPGRLMELIEKWQPAEVWHDAAGPARHVADHLVRQGVELRATRTPDYTAACSGFVAGLESGEIKFIPDERLDRAVNSAVKRVIGDAWGWGRRGSAVPVSGLGAITLAAWGVDHVETIEPFEVH